MLKYVPTSGAYHQLRLEDNDIGAISSRQGPAPSWDSVGEDLASQRNGQSSTMWVRSR